MASQHSAGIVLHRCTTGADHPPIEATVEIMLVHPGGPFWANKDKHGWSIPKGEFDPDEEPGRQAAWREFEEELGRAAPEATNGEDPAPLPPFKAGRKTIHAWLVAADFDTDNITSNIIEIEWPPRSGQAQEIPEVDRAAWFTLAEARTKLHKGQVPLIDLIIRQIA